MNQRSNPLKGQPKQDKVCRYCSEPIKASAKVCHHCSRHQNRFWQHFRIEQVGLLVSIVMIVIAFSQLHEARQERIAANNALKKAQQAERDIKKLQAAFMENALSVISITWLDLETRSEFGTERAKKGIRETVKELNSTLQKIIPDPKQRSAWIQELRSRIPKRK